MLLLQIVITLKYAGGERCALTITGELVFDTKFEEIKEAGEYINYRDFQECYDYQNYIYNREFLISNEIQFPDYLRYQDPPFFVEAMHTAGCFYALPVNFYCYRFGHQDRKLIESRINWILMGIRDISKIAVDNGYEKLLDHIVETQLNDEYYRMICGNLTDDNILLLLQIKGILGEKYRIRVIDRIRSVRDIDDEITATVEKLMKIEKSQHFLRTLLKKKSQGWTLSDYLIKNYGNRIVLYGAGFWGTIVYEELKGSEVTIVGVIDRNMDAKIDGIKTYSIYDPIPENDLILVALLYPDEALSELRSMFKQPILAVGECL